MMVVPGDWGVAVSTCVRQGSCSVKDSSDMVGALTIRASWSVCELACCHVTVGLWELECGGVGVFRSWGTVKSWVSGTYKVMCGHVGVGEWVE